MQAGPDVQILGCKADPTTRYEVYDLWEGVQRIVSSADGRQGTWNSTKGTPWASGKDDVLDIVWADGAKDKMTIRDGKQVFASSPGKVFEVVNLILAPRTPPFCR